MRRRVNFFGNPQDQTILIAALLGWRVKDIAAFAGVTEGQAYYRLHTLAGISVMQCRGASKLSHQILTRLRHSPMMNAATKSALRAADITPKFDPENKTLRS